MTHDVKDRNLLQNDSDSTHNASGIIRLLIAIVWCQDYTDTGVQGTQYSTGPRLSRQKTKRWKIAR